MCTYDTDYMSTPVCPWCGKHDDDWWDGSELKGDGDCSRTECGWCEKPILITMHVEYSFCTDKRDPEAEAQKERVRQEHEAARVAEREAAAAQFPPGTRYRVNNPSLRAHGKCGTVANRESSQGFIYVRHDDRNYDDLINPTELEARALVTPAKG